MRACSSGGSPAGTAGAPIHADCAGWCAGAFRWAGAERFVQCAKEGTEAFDDPFPARKSGPSSRRTFESLRNWLSAFTPTRDPAFEDGGLGRPSLVWEEEGMPRRLNGPRPTLPLGWEVGLR